MVALDNLCVNISVSVSLFIWCLYLYLTRTFDHWKKKEVVFKPPVPLFGNFKKLFLHQKRHGVIAQELYNSFPNEPFIGIYFSSIPILLVKDPQLIKQILVKDFHHFHDRFGNLVDNTRDELLSQNLLLLSGAKWRQLRQKLSPSFTSGKLKTMFHLLVEIGSNLESVLLNCTNSDNLFEMRDLSARYTTDVISSMAFGINANLAHDLNSQFREIGTKSLKYFTSFVTKYYFRRAFPFLGKFVSLKTFPANINNFYIKIVKDVISSRKKKNVTRNDFMQLLIKLQDHGSIDKEDEQESTKFVFDDVLLAAQVFIFLVAGFDTSSTVMSFILCELALNPDIQTKAQREIDKVLKRYDGQLTYNALQELTYLDQVLCEGLRKYPPIAHLDRICTIPYIMPGTNVALCENDLIEIPIYALHHDPQYFQNPLKFDPERFSAEGKKTIHPYTYMPFGEGPRMCSSPGFAKIKIMAGLASILRKFDLFPCSKTDITLEYNNYCSSPQSYNGLWLQIKRRE